MRRRPLDVNLQLGAYSWLELSAELRAAAWRAYRAVPERLLLVDRGLWRWRVQLTWGQLRPVWVRLFGPEPYYPPKPQVLR